MTLLVERSIEETAAIEFMDQISAHDLFRYDPSANVYVQDFSLNGQVAHGDVEDARAFAESLRKRFGIALHVEQRNSSVRFTLGFVP